MKLRKLIALTISILMILSMAVTVSAEEEIAGFNVSNMPEGGYTVGVCNFSLANSFRTELIGIVKAKLDEYKELGLVKEYYETNSDGDATQQINDMQDLITKGCDIIIITAASSSALAAVTDEAAEEGIIVGNFDADVDSDMLSAFCAMDNYACGYAAGSWMCEQLGGEGNVVIVGGHAGSKNAIDRIEGATAACEEHEGINIVNTLNCDYDYAKAKAAMESVLASQGEELDGCLSLGGGMTQGCIDAYASSGLDFVPFTGDSGNGYLKRWKQYEDDGINCMSWYINPAQGAICLDMCLKVAGGETLDEPVNKIQPIVIDSSTIDNYVRTDLSDSYWPTSDLTEEQLQEWFGEDA